MISEGDSKTEVIEYVVSQKAVGCCLHTGKPRVLGVEGLAGNHLQLSRDLASYPSPKAAAFVGAGKRAAT